MYVDPRCENPVFSIPETNSRKSSSPIRLMVVKEAKETRRKSKKIISPTTHCNDALQTIANTKENIGNPTKAN